MYFSLELIWRSGLAAVTMVMPVFWFSVLSPNLSAQESPSATLEELATIEKAAADYLTATPVGRVSAKSVVVQRGHDELHTTLRSYFDGASLFIEIDRLFGVGQKRSDAWPRPRTSLLHDGTLATWHFPDSAIQVKRLDSYPGSPWEAENIFFPRYIGTGLVTSMLSMSKACPRGLLGESGLVPESAAIEDVRGIRCMVGTYKDALKRTVKLWWATDEPVRLMRSEVSVLTRQINHLRTVDVFYKKWPCGVTFPERVVSTDVPEGTEQLREELTVLSYETPDASSLDFSLGAFSIPKGHSVYYFGLDHSIEKRMKWNGASPREFTEQESSELLQRNAAFTDSRRERATIPLGVNGTDATSRLRTGFIAGSLLLLLILVWFSLRRRSSPGTQTLA